MWFSVRKGYQWNPKEKQKTTRLQATKLFAWYYTPESNTAPTEIYLAIQSCPRGLYNFPPSSQWPQPMNKSVSTSVHSPLCLDSCHGQLLPYKEVGAECAIIRSACWNLIGECETASSTRLYRVGGKQKLCIPTRWFLANENLRYRIWSSWWYRRLIAMSLKTLSRCCC